MSKIKKIILNGTIETKKPKSNSLRWRGRPRKEIKEEILIYDNKIEKVSRKKKEISNDFLVYLIKEQKKFQDDTIDKLAAELNVDADFLNDHVMENYWMTVREL